MDNNCDNKENCENTNNSAHNAIDYEIKHRNVHVEDWSHEIGDQDVIDSHVSTYKSETTSLPPSTSQSNRKKIRRSNNNSKRRNNRSYDGAKPMSSSAPLQPQVFSNNFAFSSNMLVYPAPPVTNYFMLPRIPSTNAFRPPFNVAYKIKQRNVHVKDRSHEIGNQNVLDSHVSAYKPVTSLMPATSQNYGKSNFTQKSSNNNPKRRNNRSQGGAKPMSNSAPLLIQSNASKVSATPAPAVTNSIFSKPASPNAYRPPAARGESNIVASNSRPTPIATEQKPGAPADEKKPTKYIPPHRR